MLRRVRATKLNKFFEKHLFIATLLDIIIFVNI